MKHLRILAVFAAFGLLAVGAGAVIAALGDSETASGTITVSSESADLYICEPGTTPGPECGADDSDGAEIVFEGDEQFIPGESRYYDIRLRNVGQRSFVVTDLNFLINETADPGNNCPDHALWSGGHPNRYWDSSAVWILDDPAGDDSSSIDSIRFPYEDTSQSDSVIAIGPGEHEDVRLRLKMDLFDTENCDGNVWDVSFEFVVN
jgi:hypothetical protein